MKIKVLDAGTLGDDLSLSPLDACGEVTVYRNTSPDELIGRISDADILILNKVRINRNHLGYAPSLKLICITATGYDNVDVEACRERGVGVTNVVGYSTDSVAQVTVSMVLSLACHLPEYDAFVRDGRYSAGNSHNRLTPAFHELAGMTWGVVGFGHIGQKVAAIAAAFGCRVITSRRYTAAGDSPYPVVPIKELCRLSDIITLHIPLTPETNGLISAGEIADMKTGVILVNAARGAVLDESAVTEAVLSGKIGGFGTDVFTREPFPTDHPFSRLRDSVNTVMTPHMAWGAYEARERCIDEIARNIRSYQNGGRRCRLE